MGSPDAQILMNADTSLSLVIAAMCVLAVGVSATTLDSSLSTDPDDVIDIEWDKLPISKEDAATVQREIRAQQDRQSRPASDSGRESRSEAERNSEENSQARRSSSESQEHQQSREQKQSRDSEPREPTIWEKLLALLRDLLPWLLALGMLAAGGALAYRYRERLRALATLVASRSGLEPTPDEGPDWFAVEPATEIDRMWFQVVQYLDPDDPGSRTVAELAERAIEAGLDPDGVHELADVFREVRYGGVPVTEEQERRAAAGYSKLDLGDGSRVGRDRGDPRTRRPAGGGSA